LKPLAPFVYPDFTQELVCPRDVAADAAVIAAWTRWFISDAGRP